MTSIDDVVFVPDDVDLEQVREAFGNDDPHVLQISQQVKYRELAGVVLDALRWFLEHERPKLAGAVLASTFRASQRRGITDAELAAENGMDLRAFRQHKRRLLRDLELRAVPASTLTLSES